MEWAKTGEIHHRCGPNALSTFREYLIDYTSGETQNAGEEAIAKELEQMDKKDKKISETFCGALKTASGIVIANRFLFVKYRYSQNL